MEICAKELCACPWLCTALDVIREQKPLAPPLDTEQTDVDQTDADQTVLNQADMGRQMSLNVLSVSLGPLGGGSGRV